MFLLEIEAETHPLAVRPASTALSGEGDWGWGQQANHLQRIVGPSPAWVWPPYSASLSPKFYEVSQCSYAAGPTIQPWTTPPFQQNRQYSTLSSPISRARKNSSISPLPCVRTSIKAAHNPTFAHILLRLESELIKTSRTRAHTIIKGIRFRMP